MVGAREQPVAAEREEIERTLAGGRLLVGGRGKPQQGTDRTGKGPRIHTDNDVLEDRQIREQADVLKGAGDAALEHLMGSKPTCLLAGEADGAVIGRD